MGKDYLNAEQKANLCRKITEVIVKEGKMLQEHTWVIIHEVPRENWMANGETVPEILARLEAEGRWPPA